MAEELKKWTFRRDISIGNLITLASVIAGIFWWTTSVEVRLQKIELALDHVIEVVDLKLSGLEIK